MGTSLRVASVASRAIWGDFESEGETNVEPTSEPDLQKSNLESVKSSNLGNNGTIHVLSSNKLNEDASQSISAVKSHIASTEGCHNPVSDLSDSSNATISTEPVNSLVQNTTDALPLHAISEFPSLNHPQHSCEHELSSDKSPPTISKLHEVGLCEDKKSLNALELEKLVTKQESAAGIENDIPEEKKGHMEGTVDNQAGLKEITQENVKDENFSKDHPDDENCATKENYPGDKMNEENCIEVPSKKDEQPQDLMEGCDNLDYLENMEMPTEDGPVKNNIVDENYSVEHLSGDNNVREVLSENNSVKITHTDKEELSTMAPENDNNIKSELINDKPVIKIKMKDRDDKQETRCQDSSEGPNVVKDGQMKEEIAKCDVTVESTLKAAPRIITIEGTMFKDPYATKKGISPGDSTEKQHPAGEDCRNQIHMIEDSITENTSKDATSEIVTQFSSAEHPQTVEADLTSECKRVEATLVSDSISESKSADENTLPPSNFSSAPQTLNDEKIRGEESSEKNSGKADRSNFEAASPRTNTGNNPKRTDSKGADSMFYLDTHFFIRIMARCANLRPSGMTKQKCSPQQTPHKALDLSETTPPRGKHRTSRSGSSTPDKWKRSLREKIKDKIGDRLHKYKD